MDPLTQRMLERARARQEIIDQKLANSGQALPKRKPLSENIIKGQASPVTSPVKTKQQISSPRKSKETVNCNTPVIKKVIEKSDYSSNQRAKNDIIVTKKEFKSRKSSLTRRNSDVSIEINISHKNDIQIEVQVEERDAPISVTYDAGIEKGNNVVIKELEDDCLKGKLKEIEMEQRNEKSGLSQNVKSRLDRLGNLYSDKPNLSSPIHRTEQQFTCDTPPVVEKVERAPFEGKRKFGKLAALADQINNWEDDLSHHTFQPDTKKSSKKEDKHESPLDVSIHSIKDINTALQSVAKQSKPNPAHTFVTPVNECQRLNRKIVAELESEGYRRVSKSQSRLVYDFATNLRNRQEPITTPSATPAPNMAAETPVTKRPSIKKYKAPTPPRIEEVDSDKDKENNVMDDDVNSESAQMKDDKPVIESPVKRFGRFNSNDRSSVMSKAAMFESGSPRTKEKDPAEMSLRERKALFEKNKGAAIVPKAPFGLAPSVKTLHGDKDTKKTIHTPTKNTPEKCKSNPKDEDSISQSSLGGGIKGKLAALFSKEQTISETSITNKFKQERDKEMEMLQNRFHHKPNPTPKQENNESDEDNDHESEKAPLMGSTISLSATKKPEIIANVPKVDKPEKVEEKVQPAKRRSSQDSPVVLSVLEDVKRIKVNGKENNAIVTQPTSLYPHLSDIETDHSNTQEEYSDCGGSSTENIPDKLNKSENWAETSFGREVLNVVTKKNTSYKKAVQSDSDDESGACDSELDELLDEALDDEGPTPPKVNKQDSLSSSSFVYQDKGAFKSPLKTPARDRGNELVHSVSFYRRMQASSTPTTPMRVVRHASPERDVTDSTDTTTVTTVRQRIKELHNEINKQQTVISQASQALNLCASTIEFCGSTEQAEGERLLLLATHRRQACLHEVQRLQVEGAGPAATAGMATLSITNLRMPLRRDYIRQLNADGAVGHHVVCLLKCRDRVLATSMQLTKPNAPLLFPDEIRMDGLSSDFKVTVEIYLLQASKEILPHNVKYHITNKKGGSKLLTPKSKVSELKAPRVTSPAGPLSVRSPQFSLHGYCIFALQQAGRKSFTLNKVPHDSPLEGSIYTDIAARVLVPAPEPHAAFLTAFDDVSGLGAWHRRWFRLQPPRLTYWKYPDDVTRKMPIGDIDLTTIISEKALKAPRDLCARPHTILLEASVPPGLEAPEGGSLVYYRAPNGAVIRRHLLAADTAADRDAWLDGLNRALDYVRCAPTDSE